MNIGLDAKRAFHNNTGLGNYSRTLIQSLSQYHPEHEYFLFNPKLSNKYQLEGKNIHEIIPTRFIDKLFTSAWRSSWVKNDLKKLNIELYHGLSHEIPIGINKTGIKSIVTIHDLIYKRYPNQFNPIDVKIYDKKFNYASKNADHIIAISHQTKQDIINYFGTSPEKISVCHISCAPSFADVVDQIEKDRIKKLFNLPNEYFLYVGSIIERKNLLNICRAILLLKPELNIPLVVIGNGKKYKEQVKTFVKENGLENEIIFLSENINAKTSSEFFYGSCFPAIYQSAIAMIFPSIFEGFGLPVLEALWSKTPVITSNISSLPEVGGKDTYYVDPFNPKEIAEGMKKIYSDKSFTENMKTEGWKFAQHFTQENCANFVMDVYKKIC